MLAGLNLSSRGPLNVGSVKLIKTSIITQARKIRLRLPLVNIFIFNPLSPKRTFFQRLFFYKIDPAKKSLFLHYFDIKFSKLSKPVIRIFQKSEQVMFIYLKRKQTFLLKYFFLSLFSHWNRMRISLWSENIVSMDPELQNVWVSILKFKMATFNMATWSRKFSSEHNNFLW